MYNYVHCRTEIGGLIMKSFFCMFKSSFDELKDLRTLVVTGMLIALAIILKMLAIQITEDLRISFSFIAIATIGMLYGPVVCSMSAFSVDLLGYLIANKTARGYYPPLALVGILAGIVWGIFLYKRNFNKTNIFIFNIILARLSVTIICNIMLNTYFLYTGFVNPEFSLFSISNYTPFFIYLFPRLIKNVVLFPIESILLISLLPVIARAYYKINPTSNRKNRLN